MQWKACHGNIQHGAHRGRQSIPIIPIGVLVTGELGVNEALRGGIPGPRVKQVILATGLLADLCFALPEAEIGVMNLPAMARITKLPLERLEALSATSPVFAPGVANYLRMGAIEEIWQGDLEGHLAEALRMPATRDRRRVLGETRGGRQLARSVAERVRSDERG